MSKAQSLSLTYRIQVLYRFVIAFILGFICTALLSLTLTHLFHLSLPKAESIFLAAFISLIFYVFFVMTFFCIQSLKKLTLMSTASCAVLFVLFLGVG
jgi:hypothetical protein